MRILFVNNTFPFPPSNGVELPIASFAAEFALQHEIYFALIGDVSSKKNMEKPAFVQSVFHITPLMQNKYSRLLKEFLLIQPFYYLGQYNKEELEKQFKAHKFDAIWVGVDGLLGFAEFYKKHFNPDVKIIMGINEPQYTIKANTLRDFVRGRIALSKEVVVHFFRYFTIKGNEKRYLKRADVIHVHTEVDKARTLQLIGKNSKVRVVRAPNGIKEDILQLPLSAGRKKIVLFMTHLDDSRELEYPWFVNKVWQAVVAANQDAELWMVGKPANAKHKSILSQVKGVKLVGFADDLCDLFSQVRITVVPITQNHGLINRVVDSMAAGVPVVAMKEPVSTLEGFQNGVHGFCTNDVHEMLKHINVLLQDDAQWEKMSHQSKDYALSRPTWKESANLLLNALQE